MDTEKNELFLPFKPKELLANRLFYVLDGQILFYRENTLMLTNISSEHNYSKTDYDLLPEGSPFQLINGKLLFMPAPKVNHQRVLNRINVALFNFVVSNNLGEVFIAPTDVEFDTKNVVQPDLIFVSIRKKDIVREARIIGVPEFVVEILSPGTEKYDRKDKLSLFGQFGVEECWLIDLSETQVEIYQNEQREMKLIQKAAKGENIKSKTISGFEISVDNLFD